MGLKKPPEILAFNLKKRTALARLMQGSSNFQKLQHGYRFRKLNLFNNFMWGFKTSIFLSLILAEFHVGMFSSMLNGLIKNLNLYHFPVTSNA